MSDATHKPVKKWSYVAIIVLNALYIFLFYLLMKTFS